MLDTDDYRSGMDEEQLKWSLRVAALLATVLPPVLGGTAMSLMGFYPIGGYYDIFSYSFVIAYVACALVLMQVLADRITIRIHQLAEMERTVSQAAANLYLRKLPWFFIIPVSIYSMGGIYLADIAFEDMGIISFSTKQHLLNQLGIVPVVIITAYPIYFYLINRIGRFLGPRGVIVNAHPLWVKVLILGVVTPLLIDSIIVGYYVIHTERFGVDTIVLWSSLLLVAVAGAWIAWVSFRQSMAPLEAFARTSDEGEQVGEAREYLKPLSMDEFGVLTNRILRVIERDRQSALLADAVMEAAGALVVVLGRDGRIVRFNRACEQLSGYLMSEVEGKYPWDTVLPAEDADEIRKNAFEALANQPEALAGNYSNDWVAKSGKKYRIDWSNTLLLDDSGQMDYMVSIGIDVTEQRRVEDQLKESNQVVTAVLDTTSVLIAYMDDEFNFVHVNRPYAEADNKTPEFFVGKNHFSLFPNEENEAIFRKVVESGEAHSTRAKPFEYEHAPERGVTHWDWTLTPIKDGEGVVTGLVLSLLDVTDRIVALEAVKSNERELLQLNESLESRVAERTTDLSNALSFNEQMLASLVVGVSAYSENGDCVFANQAMADLINATHEQVLAQNFRKIESWQQYGLLTMAETVLESGVRRQGEFHIVSTFGREIWIDATFARFERSGEPHLLLLISDITDRKQAEEEMITAREAAEKASHAKNDFLSRMSHELRTPLNAILGFAQVLDIEDISEIQHEYVDEIHNAGTHLLALINELLDLSRIESGKLNVSVQVIEIDGVVSEAEKLVEKVFIESGQSLNNLCENGTRLMADPIRLRQVLVNFLTNAAKYNRTGGTVTIDCVAHDDERMRIQITDTGPGIAEDKLDDLFVPFERLGAENSVIEGTGIGLAIAKQMVELMGGEVGVDTVAGEGSTFWIDLPMMNEGGETIADVSIVKEPETTIDHRKILYIEDNPANLRVVQAIFRRQPQVKLLAATNGAYGLVQAKEYAPDLILLDIHLPDMDGYAVLEALKTDSSTADIPVVALSADAMTADVEKGIEAGFVNYITKPVIVDELLGCIEEILNKEDTTSRG